MEIRDPLLPDPKTLSSEHGQGGFASEGQSCPKHQNKPRAFTFAQYFYNLQSDSVTHCHSLLTVTQ